MLLHFRAKYTQSGANHAEGGWPKDVNILDIEATQRYRRKIEKDDGYIHCVMALTDVNILFLYTLKLVYSHSINGRFL